MDDELLYIIFKVSVFFDYDLANTIYVWANYDVTNLLLTNYVFNNFSLSTAVALIQYFMSLNYPF